MARRGRRFRDPIEAIELVACAFLSMPSERVKEAFGRAFRRFAIEPGGEG